MFLFTIYIIINIFNFLFTIFLKFILKNIYTTSEIFLRNKRIIFLIKDIYYKNNTIDFMKVTINNKLFPSMYINYLEYRINKLTIPAEPQTKFKLWQSSNNLNYILQCTNTKISDIGLFNLFMRYTKIYYSSELYFDIYGINIFKLSKDQEFIKLKITNIKIYYLNRFVGKINNIKITFKEKKTIYFYKINILINKILIDHYFIEAVNKIYTFFTSSKSKILPRLMVHKMNINIYLHNYILLKLNNFVIEDSILHIAQAKVKIWKKDSIWIDNLKMDILNKEKKPVIENIKLRLFQSTSDKLYKTLIILRKKFIPLTKKNIKQNYQKKVIVINNNYLKNIKEPTEELINNENCTIINEYFNLLHLISDEFKLIIINMTIKFNPDYGEIYVENLEYITNEEYNIMAINYWKFYYKKTIFIEKHLDEKKKFYIKFKKESIYITPYKMNIYFDFFYFKNMCTILKKNIERINNLFYSNYYIYNKGYVYESFHIESFLGILNYKKTEKNFKALISGNSIELINYINIADINLLLNEVHIYYPNDWNNIVNKIAHVYKKSIYNNNFKSIITKISGENTASLIYIKHNFKYIKNKVINSIKNK